MENKWSEKGMMKGQKTSRDQDLLVIPELDLLYPCLCHIKSMFGCAQVPSAAADLSLTTVAKVVQ